MTLPTTLQRSRSAVVYIKAETTAGQIADAPVASDAFGLTSVPVIAQAGNYTDTSEIGSELISVDRVLNYMDYATFDLEFYAKPKGQTSGSALSSTGITISGGVATVAMTSTAGLAVGDTITIAGSTGVSGLNGDHIITVFNENTDVRFATSLTGTVAGTITVTKKTLNTPPEHVILSKLFGGTKFSSLGGTYSVGDASTANVTVSNKTVISYFLKNQVDTMTVHSLQETDTTVQYYAGKGALPTSFSLAMAKDGPLTMSVGFQASKVLYAGTASVGSNSITGASTTTITLDTPKRYASGTAVASDVFWFESAESQGTPVKIVSNDGATVKKDGLEVTAVSGATITVGDTQSPAAAYANNDLIIPDLPAPSCDTTTTIDQRSVQVFIADQVTGSGLTFSPSANTDLFHADNELDVTAASIDFDRSISTPGLTEMTGEAFPPASYVINEPTISGSISLLLRPKDFQFMNSLREEPKRSIGIRIGTVDGKIIEIGCGAVHMEVPSASEADGATSIDIPFNIVRGADCDDSDKFFLRYR